VGQSQGTQTEETVVKSHDCSTQCDATFETAEKNTSNDASHSAKVGSQTYLSDEVASDHDVQVAELRAAVASLKETLVQCVADAEAQRRVGTWAHSEDPQVSSDITTECEDNRP
jgi:hypothetical protein